MVVSIIITITVVIIKTIFNAQVQEKNEMFFPGRMAYIVELEEDITDSSTVTDIPTTIIRSKADIAAGAANQQSLSSSTNDIVINKLTQILSYLRAGKHNKKKKRDRNDFIEKMPETSKKVQENKIGEDLPIYDDVGDYVPSGRSNRDRDRDRDRERGDRRDRDRDRSDRPGTGPKVHTHTHTRKHTHTHTHTHTHKRT